MLEEKIGKRERNRIQNHQSILNAAKTCFSEKGYDQVTVRDIIRRTGLASGTFYNYFPDKQSIFSALIDNYMISLNANIQELHQKAKTVESYIYSTYLAIFKTISEDRVIYKLAHNNEKVIENLYGCSVIGNTLNLLAKDINDAISKSLIPNIDAELLAAAFLGVANQLGLRVAESVNPDPESTARFAERLFMGGIHSASKRIELESA
jgi:AcrR family transcriptional regulator